MRKASGKSPRAIVDAASIDCVTYGFFNDCCPEKVSALRVLDSTPEIPAIPFVTSIATPAGQVDALRSALLCLADDPSRKAVLRRLSIETITAVKIFGLSARDGLRTRSSRSRLSRTCLTPARTAAGCVAAGHAPPSRARPSRWSARARHPGRTDTPRPMQRSGCVSGPGCRRSQSIYSLPPPATIAVLDR